LNDSSNHHFDEDGCAVTLFDLTNNSWVSTQT